MNVDGLRAKEAGRDREMSKGYRVQERMRMVISRATVGKWRLESASIWNYICASTHVQKKVAPGAVKKQSRGGHLVSEADARRRTASQRRCRKIYIAEESRGRTIGLIL